MKRAASNEGRITNKKGKRLTLHRRVPQERRLQTMSPLVHVTACGQSDIGLVRKNNEDSYLITDLTKAEENAVPRVLDYRVGKREPLLLVVADGMGGAEAGEVASQMAVKTSAQQFPKYWKKRRLFNRRIFVESLKNTVEHANTIIYAESQKNGYHHGMGTTCTAAGVYDGAVFFAQVGDSRAYLIRNHAIIQATQDQSIAAQLVANGELDPEKIRSHPLSSVLLQALGVEAQVIVPVSFAELKRGDLVLLCSDGLSNKLTSEEMWEIVTQVTDPENACRSLIEAAKERGGDDNITAIVARVDGEGILPPSSAEEIPICQEFRSVWQWSIWPWRKR